MPENIADQIILWEREQEVVQYELCTMIELNAAAEGEEFEQLRAAAGPDCLWASADAQVVVVRNSARQAIALAETIT